MVQKILKNQGYVYSNSLALDRKGFRRVLKEFEERVCEGFAKGLRRVCKGFARVCEGFAKGLKRVCKGFETLSNPV